MTKRQLVESAIWESVKLSPINEVIIEDNWVQLTTPGAPTPVMNGVFRCEIKNEDIETRILQTIRQYKQKGLPFRWKTCESSKPVNINELLIKHGLTLKDRLWGLFAHPDQIQLSPNPDVEIKELNMDLKKDWLVVQAIAWNVPPEGISFIDKNFHQEFDLIEKGKAKAFLAYYKGKPVASAGLLLQANYGYLVGAATAPAARKLGVYRSLMKRRLDYLESKKLPAVIHCIWNTSAPICLKLGFEKICEINSFELAN